MSDDQQPKGTLDPSFFEGRLMIDILAWDWNLRVAINPAARRPKALVHGLSYGRDFTIDGRLRAPRELRGRTMKVILSPFRPKVRFGRGGLQQVGTLKVLPPSADLDFEAMLMLPEEAIATTATSLASTWKHLQILTFDEGHGGARASAYFFHASIHPNLEGWANAE
jgi:hypothetical protein